MKKRSNPSYSIILYLRWPLLLSVLLVFMNLILLAVDPKAAAAMGVFTVLFIIFSGFLYFYSKRGLYTSLIDFAQGFDSTESAVLNGMSIPTAVCSRKGGVLWANEAFATGFGAPSWRSAIQNIFPDITPDILNELDDDAVIHSSFGDRRYLIEMRPADLDQTPDTSEEEQREEADSTAADAVRAPDGSDGGDSGTGSRTSSGLFRTNEGRVIIISVSDETELIKYKKDFEESRPCEGLIYLDNYDEALASVEETRRSLLTALVDRRISNYISSLDGIVKKLEKDKYLFFINEKDFQKMSEDRFSILEEVKTINIGNELAVTLSIGVGRTGGSYEDNYEYARAAIDLALGRGGDQAVIKSGEEVTYFGGKSLAPEKNARVKARVKAQAFRELLSANDKVLVMGHRNGDADSLGASIGIWKIARSYGKKAHIVLNSTTKSLEPLYRLFIENAEYPDDLFIAGDKAVGMIDRETLVTVVDTNRPSYTEEPRLLQNASTVVVIDHHRKGTESIENAALSYIEPYASSACEMTTELIEYIDDTTTVTQLEADALYGGIVVDTQNFVTQTGIRTFEAAAYLRRKGASVQRIRKLFRDSFSDFKAKAGAADAAEIYRKSFALSRLDPEGVDSPTVAGAQAANSLLAIDGIKAAFVLTPYNGQIFVSARSIDEVNVQVMMEQLGGGGHMSMAGAQLKDMSLDEAMDRVKSLIDEMIEKGEIT